MRTITYVLHFFFLYLLFSSLLSPLFLASNFFSSSLILTIPFSLLLLLPFPYLAKIVSPYILSPLLCSTCPLPCKIPPPAQGISCNTRINPQDESRGLSSEYGTCDGEHSLEEAQFREQDRRTYSRTGNTKIRAVEQGT
jgi:hypothetical protein